MGATWFSPATLIFPAAAMNAAFGGSGGGGPRPVRLTVTGYSRTGLNEKAIANALTTILNDILSSDNECSRWLTGASFSAAQFVNAIMGQSAQDYTFGYGAVSPNSIAAFVGNANPDGTIVQGLPLDSSITVNTNSAFFNSAYSVGSGGTQYKGNTLQAQSFILLHELAHEVGAKGFLPDLGSSKNISSNNNLVQTNCGKQVAGLP
jgi:hypothetical protein